MDKYINTIAAQLKIQIKQVENTLTMLEEGNTVPFIARYRKEVSGGLDEEAIRIIHEHYDYQVKLAKRKEDVMRLIEQLGKLDEALIAQINNCAKLSQVEDIYRPYQQKKKTRASDAIKKGLQPLADWILTLPYHADINMQASQYINETVKSAEEAILGAKDIIAEMVSDDPKIREQIRYQCERYGKLVSKLKKNAVDEKKVYTMYYDYSERIISLVPHRIMALDRGENDKILSVKIVFDITYLQEKVLVKYLKRQKTIMETLISEAVNDGLKRLAIPSVEREIRSELSQKAHEQSIEIFSLNLERLLLQPPIEQKVVLGFDPAFRTGCKLAVVDATGKLLKISVIYPHAPVNKVAEAKQEMRSLCKAFPVQIIAIGNGTASRESEAFVANFIKEEKLDLAYTIVSEAGASVYSASDLAREEFPDLQVEQRSAISIARRIIDPLSELIKIDPQSIGVGQYQHDVANARLKDRLDFVVEKAVNRVGVNINTASIELLQHISGLNKSMAKNIVAFREEQHAISSRSQIKKIPKIGAKSYEQAAGFLRIANALEVLDQTDIHPESYKLAKEILKKLKLSESDMGSEKALEATLNINISELCSELKSDEFTLKDILDSIVKPLRDYRQRYDGPLLRSDVLELEDLHVGDELEGVVRNVVDFGAFVDIGLHEDGLVHISKLSTKRVAHPSEVLSVGDIVKVWVYNIDNVKQKVQLSLVPMN